MALNVLDPTCILDIERSARHLATSVDEMTENLSGLLQGNHAGYFDHNKQLELIVSFIDDKEKTKQKIHL